VTVAGCGIAVYSMMSLFELPNLGQGAIRARGCWRSRPSGSARSAVRAIVRNPDKLRHV
jgi:hypothetical protein